MLGIYFTVGADQGTGVIGSFQMPPQLGTSHTVPQGPERQAHALPPLSQPAPPTALPVRSRDLGARCRGRNPAVRKSFQTKLHTRRPSKASTSTSRERGQHASLGFHSMLFPRVLATRDSKDSPRQRNAAVTTGAGQDAGVSLPRGDGGPWVFPAPRSRPDLAEDKGAAAPQAHACHCQP